ncbi:uncharacterized protein [Nothobranchius furzeri]|uniref:uncharacterized protein isoform X3 n=1 Tax=Nothobranchius furzeri TaxID=105023 RepID=UPI003904BD4C
MKGLQTPAAAEENEASPVPQMLNDGPIPDETYTQMKGLQTPAAAEENEASPVPQMLNDGPIPDETYTQTIHMEGPLAEDIEGDKGSDDEVSMSSRQECTSISESQNQRVSATGELQCSSYLWCIFTQCMTKISINNPISLLCPNHLLLLQLCQETCLMQRLHNQHSQTQPQF